MPLIVPGVTANNLGSNSTADGVSQQEWLGKLMGKTLTDGASSETAFSKKELPKEARIIEYGVGVTREHVQGRLNVYLSKDGTVARVDVG